MKDFYPLYQNEENKTWLIISRKNKNSFLLIRKVMKCKSQDINSIPEFDHIMDPEREKEWPDNKPQLTPAKEKRMKNPCWLTPEKKKEEKGKEKYLSMHWVFN